MVVHGGGLLYLMVPVGMACGAVGGRYLVVRFHQSVSPFLVLHARALWAAMDADIASAQRISQAWVLIVSVVQ